MKIARILNASQESFIFVEGGLAITREEIIERTGLKLPPTLQELLNTSDDIHTLEHALKKVHFRQKVEDFEITFPIAAPPKIICLNFNYKDQHEWIRFGKSFPIEPIIYIRPHTCLNGPYEDVVLPSFTTKVDYEGELAVVICKKCKAISESEAPYVIWGYMVFNDITARDIQQQDVQISRSKCLDMSAPCGPWITSRSEVEDPHNLRIITKVNGEVRQDSTTANMVLSIWQIVSKLSKVITLEPGDIISTGTPLGTVLSFHGKKPWLKTNDIVEVGIEGLGSIRNRILV